MQIYLYVGASCSYILLVHMHKKVYVAHKLHCIRTSLLGPKRRMIAKHIGA